MIGRIVLDVANGPSSPVALVLAGFFVLMVLTEFGVLVLFGMRPVGKAFTSSFLVNMAAVGTGFVLYMVGEQIPLRETALQIFVLITATVVQGLVLAANRENLGKGRAWLAALAMKATSFVVLFAVVKFLG